MMLFSSFRDFRENKFAERTPFASGSRVSNHLKTNFRCLENPDLFLFAQSGKNISTRERLFCEKGEKNRGGGGGGGDLQIFFPSSSFARLST